MDLKPCPFCGSSNLELKVNDVCGGHGVFYTDVFVRCKDCSAQGPGFTTYYGKSVDDCKNSAYSVFNERSI